jgi:ribosomal protein S18 acetylase RimI-like enzyme
MNIDTTGRIDIRAISVLQARELRALVLRPNQPPETTVFVGDDDTDALHLGAFHQQELAGIVTILHQAPKDFTGDDIDRLWVLRGMATLPLVRGQGYGVALVLSGCAYVARQQGTFLWCDARESALGFYQKLGFVIRGNRFDVPISGPHFRMWREIIHADAADSPTPNSQ